MPLIKHPFPVLERDTEQTAVLMPNRHGLYTLPKKAVFAFLGETTDQFAARNKCEKVAEFDSITKLFPVYQTAHQGEEIAFCQAPCGAAPATQILDFLIACGVEKIISCGGCGTLQDLKENEIIIPTHALRDEGTSYHYLEPARFIALKPHAIDAIKSLLDAEGMPYSLCKTWTTDAFYRETREMINYRKEEGCSVVEMECSALAACAEFRGAVFGQILFTADTLANLDKHDEREWGKASHETALRLAFEAVRRL